MANHPGSIAKRGPSYRVRLCVDGERYYFTLKNATKKQAEQFAREKGHGAPSADGPVGRSSLR